MSKEQERQIGAQEHQKILKKYGGVIDDKKIVQYVDAIGQKLAKNTERPDVRYSFHVLDTELVNAFALPGGYIYITRGLMTLANTEAELAAVIGHEIAHVTARHSAERYSHAVVASLGTSILGASLQNAQLQDFAGIGSELYLKGYSRSQENEADEVGLRYLQRAGYNVSGMAGFLSSLEAYSEFEKERQNISETAPIMQYFSTHPQTSKRISLVRNKASEYQDTASRRIGREDYLEIIDGMIFGHSPKQGFIRGNSFIHPELGFRFDVPHDFTIKNLPTQVIAQNRTGAAVIFDSAKNQGNFGPLIYLRDIWMGGESLTSLENITINGKKAATGNFNGRINGKPATIRLVAVQWDKKRFYRFVFAIPPNAPSELVDDFRKTTYSLKALNNRDRQKYNPYRIKIVTAQEGDTVKTLADRQSFEKYRERWFRVVNALPPGVPLNVGQKYKIIVEQARK